MHDFTLREQARSHKQWRFAAALLTLLLLPAAAFAQSDSALTITGGAGLTPATSAPGETRFTADEDTPVTLTATTTALAHPEWQWSQVAEDEVRALAAATTTRVLSLTLPPWHEDYTLTFTVNATRDGTTLSGVVTIAVANRNGICDRTPAVYEVIVSLVSGIDNCANITPANLSGITGRFRVRDATLTELQPQDLAGLSGITRLDLWDHDLTTVPVGTFEDMSALTRLELLQNDLASLPAGAFRGLGSLEVLELDQNDLTTLPAGVFAGLDNLEELTLDRNDLTTLPVNLFAGLGNLELLNLSRNDLAALPVGVFAGLDDLTDLRLNDNELTDTLPAGVFEELSNLNELHLDENRFTALAAGVFRGLTSLNELHLQQNDLATLPPRIFEGLPLDRLYLNHNEFTRLPEGIFTGLAGDGLSTLFFNENPTEGSGVHFPAHPFTVTLEVAENFGGAVVRIAEGVPSPTTLTLDIEGGARVPLSIPVGGDRVMHPIPGFAGTTVTLREGLVGERALHPFNASRGSVDFTIPSLTLAPATRVELSISPESIDEDDGETEVTLTARLDGYGLQEATDIAITLEGEGRPIMTTNPTTLTLTLDAGATMAEEMFTVDPGADPAKYGGDGTVSAVGTHPSLPVATAKMVVRDTFQGSNMSVSAGAGLTAAPPAQGAPESEFRFSANEDTNVLLTATSTGFQVPAKFLWSQTLDDAPRVLTDGTATDRAELALALPNRSAPYTLRFTVTATHDPGSAPLVRVFTRTVAIEVAASDAPPVITEAVLATTAMETGALPGSSTLAVAPGAQITLRGTARDEDTDQRPVTAWSEPKDVTLTRRGTGDPHVVTFAAPDTLGHHRYLFTFSVDDKGRTAATSDVTVELEVVPAVSIRALTETVTEGESARFEVTASEEPLATLTVHVALAGGKAFGVVPEVPPVEIGTETTTAVFLVPTTYDFPLAEDDTLSADLEVGAGYVTGTPRRTQATLRDFGPVPDANRDRAVNADDALILYYAYSLGSVLGAGR